MPPKPIPDARFEAAIRTAIATYHNENPASAAIHYKPPVDPDSLIQSAEVREFFGISAMTEWRWRKAGILPAPDLVIRGRNFWRRRTIDEVVAAQQAQSAEAA